MEKLIKTMRDAKQVRMKMQRKKGDKVESKAGWLRESKTCKSEGGVTSQRGDIDLVLGEPPMRETQSRTSREAEPAA